MRLLRVLESGEVWRVGETNPRRVDMRVVAATNRAPEEEVAWGRFRRDLYYRLPGATCHLTPLRDRPEDVEVLSRRGAARRAGGAMSLSGDALKLLRALPARRAARLDPLDVLRRG